MSRLRAHVFLEFEHDNGEIKDSDVQIYWSDDDGSYHKDDRFVRKLAMFLDRESPQKKQNSIRIVFEDEMVEHLQEYEELEPVDDENLQDDYDEGEE